MYFNRIFKKYVNCRKTISQKFSFKKCLLIYSLCIQSSIAVFLHAGLLNTFRCSVFYWGSWSTSWCSLSQRAKWVAPLWFSHDSVQLLLITLTYEGAMHNILLFCWGFFFLVKKKPKNFNNFTKFVKFTKKLQKLCKIRLRQT